MSRQHARRTIYKISTISALAIVFIAGAWLGMNELKTTSTEISTAVMAPTAEQPMAAKPAPVIAVANESNAVAPYTLYVKEWNISIPLPNSLKDAYYVVSTSSIDVDGTPNTIWIGLKSLDNCAAESGNNGGKALASIVRTKTGDSDPVTGKTYREIYPNGVVIGNYYYGYATRSANNICTTKDTFKKIDADFSPAAKKAKAGR